MSTLGVLLRKEFLQIIRDRTMLFQILMIPLVQIVLLGNALTFEVRHVRMGVLDDDRSTASRGLIQHLVASGRFMVAGSTISSATADARLRSGNVNMIVHIPHNFERDIVRSGAAPVELTFDAVDGAMAGIAQAYARRILVTYAADLGAILHAGRAEAAIGGPAPPIVGHGHVDVQTHGWYNPELRYADYMVPGVLVVLVTIISTLVSAMNIAREKELGTLEQLNVTPLTKWNFIAAKLIPFWLIGQVELALGLVLAHVIFHVPLRGSLLLIFAVAAVYLFVTVSIGLWISALVQTQQQAMFITFFVMMIYILMSGLFTPIRSMPIAAQWLAQLNPLKHFVEIMRAVLLKGAGFTQILEPFGVLAVFGVVVFSLSVKQYSKASG